MHIYVCIYKGEHSQDPREAVNLINGINFTRNDLHVWLAPQGCMTQDNRSQNNGNKDLIASVTIIFNKKIKISMIRIFNYNKSRTHCGRGVRTCVLRFDDAVIFQGDIKMASGLLTSADTVSEVILFTRDQIVLEKIAKHDENAGYYADDTTEEWLDKLKAKQKGVRPSTRPSTAEKIEKIEKKEKSQKFGNNSENERNIEMNFDSNRHKDNHYNDPNLDKNQEDVDFNATSSSISSASFNEDNTMDSKAVSLNSTIDSRMLTLKAKHDNFSNTYHKIDNNTNSNFQNIDYPHQNHAKVFNHKITVDKNLSNLGAKPHTPKPLRPTTDNLENTGGLADDDLMRFLKDLDKPEYNPSRPETDEFKNNVSIIKKSNEIHYHRDLKKNEIGTKFNTGNNSGLESYYIEDCDIISCKSLSFSIESTWGDRDYVGLAGIEIYIGRNFLYIHVFICLRMFRCTGTSTYMYV